MDIKEKLAKIEITVEVIKERNVEDRNKVAEL